MSWLQLISLALQFLLELWKANNSKTPEQVKLEAVAKITKDLNKDLTSVDRAIANKDALALSGHFEELSRRIKVAVDE